MRGVTFTTQGALGKSSLREANERLVLLTLLRQPGLSRLGLAGATGLSPAAITNITDRLTEQGFLAEGQKLSPAQGLPGRPRAPLLLRADARLAIGVAIGPPAATVALADLNGAVLASREIPARAAAEPAPFLAQIHGAIRELAAEGGDKLLGVAVSIPGNLDPATGLLRHATNLHWHDLDVRAALQGDLKLPFFCDNNSDLAAFAERWFRPGDALDNFVFVTLRVGIGAGIILNGQLVRGARNCAGEFGHVTLVPGGRQCVCGQRGCWEEYASDRALVRRYREYGGDGRMDSLGVVRQSRRGETAAQRALDETAESLALGLCPLILGLNPSAIALDDWGAAAWDLIEKLVWQVIRRRVPEAWREGVAIFPSSHAVDSSLAGAIALVVSRFFTSFAPDGAGETIRLRV